MQCHLNFVFDTKVSNEVGREFLCSVFVFFFNVNIYFLIGFYSLYKLYGSLILY